MRALRFQTVLFLVLPICLASGVRAQGSDNCATPMAISGNGTFAVNNTAATSASPIASCGSMGRDVWFRWQAAASGPVAVSTCGGVSADSVIAVWSDAGGGCPTTQLVCLDDSCSLQSTVTFNATAGAFYMIEIGGFSSATFSGTFTVGVAPPSGCSNPNPGPDVIVGDIPDILNVTASGGLDGLAIGTTSCNIGTAWLNWVASTPQHPVIGMNLYRYKLVDGASRFEQVGMSWLKHGFAALSGNLCCTCDGTGGSHLGLGCSDPYGAGLNGSQSSLGPRHQVNAATGVFVYPPANPPYTGTGRLCEVSLSELETTGGGSTTRYYAEGHYVTPDDAAAGNQNNNAAWREVTVSGGPTNYTFGLTGTTTREQSAIRRWPVLDPGVTLTDVQVPGDGLFVVGSRATSLGAGIHRYEFAVYNMNSDRNGGAFSVPLPAGTNVTNIGFHDITYRNGDGPGNVNFSGTDWTGTVSGGSIRWATQTQAQNASANAIRWGTLYNFRFDANVAPAAGQVTLELWKPGTPTQVAVAAQVPVGGPTVFALCFGDGSGTACPCGNNSAAGANVGCLNSLGTGGGLTSTGSASVTADTLVLQGSGMPDSSALYFQGTSVAGGGAGTTFGDGLRCASGTVIRLGTKTNVLGSSQYPTGGDALISVRGAVSAGDVRTYQCWYRNAAAFCTASTFNLTNAVQASWGL